MGEPGLRAGCRKVGAVQGGERALIRAAFDDVLDQREPNRIAYLASTYGRYPEIVRAVQDLLACQIEETPTTFESQDGASREKVFLRNKWSPVAFGSSGSWAEAAWGKSMKRTMRR